MRSMDEDFVLIDNSELKFYTKFFSGPVGDDPCGLIYSEGVPSKVLSHEGSVSGMPLHLFVGSRAFHTPLCHVCRRWRYGFSF